MVYSRYLNETLFFVSYDGDCGFVGIIVRTYDMVALLEGLYTLVGLSKLVKIKSES